MWRDFGRAIGSWFR
ncbi:Protein of unknown function [Bacillus wiedmannii]|nr:Protein of unknown function [Bacillus wiedmannii]